ncbi:MAG: toll/interleukin-1 receptor domain-containing protein, partial [Anaerolineae bacterium]|nr:toll/interleukin-1 receptor domain-containing protein [Anaerolineae bacterium]
GSESVLLLASRAALDSPYVAREWQTALQQHRPVIVAVLEPVRLPRELRGMPVVDLRGEFESGAAQLEAALNNPAAPIRRPMLWLAKLPPGVARMTRALIARDVQRVLAALLMAIIWAALLVHSSLIRTIFTVGSAALNERLNPTSPFPWLEGALAVVLIGNLGFSLTRLQTFLFLRRAFDYAALSARPRFRPFWLTVLPALFVVEWVEPLRRLLDGFGVTLAEPIPFDLLGFIAVGVAAVWAMNPLHRWLPPHHPDPDIVRWSPIGSVTAVWRSTVNNAILSGRVMDQTEVSAARAAQGGLRMQVIAAPADQDKAKAIQAAVEWMGGEVVSTADSANYDLLILSHLTPHSLIQTAIQTGKPLLGVLVSRCNLPDELRRLQLVDFSRKDSNALFAALGLLTARSDQERMGMQAYRDPVNLSQVRSSASVEMAGLLLLVMALGCLVALLAVIVLAPANALLYGAALFAAGSLLTAVYFNAARGRALLPRPLLTVLVAVPIGIGIVLGWADSVS